ncbi:MAG: hypothetical protein CVT86_03145 [Alphaproteobacteria bacterium HGW-Alphaproteobacteria-8]|nr:MAG: hypothetical protein CVT86_03145 [Alphaproteobacteria bacterium HGW-Alphaproteobacteria-8]
MRRTLMTAAAALFAFAALAAAPLDLLFETKHMAGVSAGETLRYHHVRTADPALGLGPDFAQVIALEMGQGQAARFTLDAEGAGRVYPVAEGVPGNPLLMVFLENTLRTVAKATGGSAFYLRNRIRFALRDALTEEADGALTIRPFLNDANRAKMGPFGDLEMRIEVSEAQPGMLVAMRARAGDAAKPAYLEEIRLENAQ